VPCCRQYLTSTVGMGNLKTISGRVSGASTEDLPATGSDWAGVGTVCHQSQDLGQTGVRALDETNPWNLPRWHDGP
jgi:hypothetical protein